MYTMSLDVLDVPDVSDVPDVRVCVVCVPARNKWDRCQPLSNLRHWNALISPLEAEEQASMLEQLDESSLTSAQLHRKKEKLSRDDKLSKIAT